MKLNAVGVTSSNIPKTVSFYQLLGFIFPSFKETDLHLEPSTPEGAARLMIDAKSIIKDIIGVDPKPGNHASFAIQYDTPKEVDEAVMKVKQEGFTVVKAPWDAFWGQRYSVVEDPDGYKIDLYAGL